MEPLRKLQEVLIEIGCYEELIAEIKAGNTNASDTYATTYRQTIGALIMWDKSTKGSGYWDSKFDQLYHYPSRILTTQVSAGVIREFLLSSEESLTTMTYRSLNEHA